MEPRWPQVVQMLWRELFRILVQTGVVRSEESSRKRSLTDCVHLVAGSMSSPQHVSTAIMNTRALFNSDVPAKLGLVQTCANCLEFHSRYRNGPLIRNIIYRAMDKTNTIGPTFLKYLQK